MPSKSKTKNWDWQVRYTVILMCCAATFICYIDRVNISVAIIPMAEQYNWDLQTQGTVLSSFYVGYLLMQVMGGFLADRFGGKIVLGVGVLLWSFFTIVTPWAALSGMLGLLVARVCMGLGEAVTFPSVYSLVSRWFPSNETAKAVALNASGIPIGTVFALLLTPIIVEQLGWEWAFYLFGLLGVAWYIAWTLTVTTNPEDHPKISTEELLYIRANAPAQGKINTPPIGAFLRNKAVWAIIVAHFCTNWTSYVFLSWLPKYVNDGLGVPFAAIGLIAMLPHLTSFVCLNIAGNIADRLVQRGYTTTFVRKLMQTIGFGGLATCLLLITTVDTVWPAIGLLC